MENKNITISADEYEYLLKCKKRAEAIRANQKKWRDKNIDSIRANARKNYKKRKENKNER